MKPSLIRLFMLFSTAPSIAQSLTERLDSLMQSHFPTNQPGAALLVKQGNQVRYSAGFGLARTDTQERITPATTFRMASVSKQFTAMGILLLEHRGQLKFSDTLLKFFPDFNPTIGTHVTLHHLLTHTSGLTDYEEVLDTTRQEQILDGDVLDLIKTKSKTYFEPGSRFRYSNSGFCLLALVVERVSGQSYARFMQDNVFVPLGMNHTALYDGLNPPVGRALGYARNATGKLVLSDQSLTSATRGDGCVYTSLNDYQRWHEALQNNQLLDPNACLARVHYDFPEQPAYQYGLGWLVIHPKMKEAEWHHTGSTCGFSNVVIRHPKRNLVVAFFSNIADSHAIFDQIVQILNKDSTVAPENDWRILHQLTR